MPAEDDITLDEKRVFAETTPETVAWVAAGMGVTRVSVAGAQIGRFRLAHRCAARDLAAGDGRLYVATDEDVLVGTVGGFESSGFGPAVAVGIDDGTPLAAGPEGRVGALEGDDWVERGTVPTDVRRLEGDLVAAADGVYHVGSGVTHAGLDDARDVAGDAGYAATGTGLYHRHDGWNGVVDGEATVVVAEEPGPRAHAVVDGDLRARADEHMWQPCTLPVDEQVVDLAYGDSVLAVTAAGTLLAAATEDPKTASDPGWRHRSLGLADVAALAVA